MATTHSRCEFCTKFNAAAPIHPAWFDREVFKGDALTVVPALGALSIGSVMVVTRHHYRSMRSAPQSLLLSVVAVADAVLQYLRERDSPAIVFEHGGGVTGGGSCIEHAHLQIAPTAVDLVSAILEEQALARFSRLNSLADLPAAIDGNHAYLLLQSQGGVVHVSDQVELSSQYVRRTFAKVTNQAEEWDYVAYPHLERVRATLELFSDLQSFVKVRI